MKKSSLLILMVCAALSSSAMLLAEPDKGRIFLKEVPAELSARVQEKLEECAREHAISESVAASVRTVVTNFSFKKLDTMRPLREKIQEAGPSAIPVVSEFLISTDESARQKAVFALRYLIRNPENAPREYTPTDSLLAALLSRAVLDKNPKVRMSAITGLNKVACSSSEDAVPDVLAGIELAVEDPDPKVGSLARAYVKSLTSAE